MMKLIACTAVALLLLVGVVQANFLETELGAQAMGMGGAFVAVADDVTALHWNPAGLAGLERSRRSSGCGPASTASKACPRTRRSLSLRSGKRGVRRGVDEDGR